ncbi:helix-turn-helix transcriptional regulator [Thermoactinomyces intermedius]|jgi:transcriptional regulator with XRE-family HTH domain|uniref:Helix-turn-helix transcriptional regulator n=1 Tax=Thermoactinomyces intermedius TaxID=2024 RepID=A0A8I1DDA0_THEIN|nr:helix-turn-helix transcriptional regulator [Thermoactinomyces intermedius]MBA4835770.1 helix-turn-helix transcriptional regulator [Thermoactinomyces intermedius]MBH8596353.1 helix-turn-helix transcriptional regulator [Thermoactinomyces intermedius]MBH8600495.1 helix-turn-helix transcriptional regulator [Thermoactinomyces sp. CICC 23799]
MRKNRIREFRKQRGLTQYELALMFRDPVHPTYISRWERGVSAPTVDHLLELARIFQVRPDEIYIID